MTAKIAPTGRWIRLRQSRTWTAATSWPVAAAVGGADGDLGFHLPPTPAHAAPIQGQPWYRDTLVPEINAWLTIAPDDTVTIRVAQNRNGNRRFHLLPDDGGGRAQVRLEQGAR